MGLTLTELYPCALDSLARELLSEFVKMVEWWAEKASAFRSATFNDLRNTYYSEWIEKWPDWNRGLAHMSAIQAYSRLGIAKPESKRPRRVELNLPIAVLHPLMVRIWEETLRISVKRGYYSYVKLQPQAERGRKLLKQAEGGLWGLGQVILAEKWAIISFTKEEITADSLKLIEELLK